MKATDELEPQQYERQYWEEDVPLKDVRESVLRRFVYLACGLFALFLLAGFTIRFPDELELPFVLKSGGEEAVYRFPITVTLMEMYVHSGDTVQEGRPLARILSPEIAALITDYKAAMQGVETFRQHRLSAAGAQQHIYELQAQQNLEQTVDTRRQLQVLDSMWNSNRQRLQMEYDEAVRKHEANKQLYEGRYISQLELKGYQLARVAAANALHTATQQYRRDRNFLATAVGTAGLEERSIAEQMNKAASDTRYDSSQALSRLQLAEARIASMFGHFSISGDGSLILLAEKPGVVSYVFDGDRQLAYGAMLMRIAGKAGAPYAAISCPPSVIGKMATGQEAYLRLATFPAYEWGTVRGETEIVSLTPDEHGAFYVKLKIADERKMKGLLRAGMNGTATIVLNERTFFQYFARSTKKIYYRLAPQH